jgi:hypothetical protein
MKKQNQPQTTATMECLYDNHVALTKGNSYEVLQEDENKVYVIDDNGKRNSFYKSRFVQPVKTTTK